MEIKVLQVDAFVKCCFCLIFMHRDKKTKMAEGARSCDDINESDIQAYYAKGQRFSTACCTAQETARYTGDIGQIMKQLHPDILARYYGCGLVAPDVLHGLDLLDLGCGVEVDCFILSRLVEPAGHVTGVDMTKEQLDLANKHRVYHSKQFGFARPNTMFVQAYIEDLKAAGLMDCNKDVIVSNCVMSLSFDKEAVLSEACRVLKPGGEMYFSDMYCNKEVPKSIKNDSDLWNECFGGAITYEKLRTIAQKVGFAEPILYETEQMDYHDEAILKKIPEGIEFRAATFRLFKLPKYPIQKSSKMKITYFGGIRNSFFQFCLTSKIMLKRGQKMIVSREIGEALKLSRYGKYLGFEVLTGDEDQKLPTIQTNDPYAEENNSPYEEGGTPSDEDSESRCDEENVPALNEDTQHHSTEENE